MKKTYCDSILPASVVCIAVSMGGIVRAADIETTVSMEMRTVRFQNGVNGYAGALDAGFDKAKPKTAFTGLNRATMKSVGTIRHIWDNLTIDSTYECHAGVTGGKKTAKTETRAFCFNSESEWKWLLCLR